MKRITAITTIILAVTLTGMTAGAADPGNLPPTEVTGTIEGKPGELVELSRWDNLATTGATIGETCTVTLTGLGHSNQHPGNDVVVESATAHTFTDVENPSTRETVSGTVVLDNGLLVSLRLGETGVSSGVGRIVFDCAPPAPETTTTTTTSVPPTVLIPPVVVEADPVVLIPPAQLTQPDVVAEVDVQVDVVVLPEAVPAEPVVAEPAFTG